MMEEAYSSDLERSEVSVGSDAHSSSLSLQSSASSIDNASLRESDEDNGSGVVEPYLYEPEVSEEEASVGGADSEGEDSGRERLSNTDW